MNLLIMLILYVGLCFIFAHFLGRKRQVGFGWSIFFCFFMSPIVGFIVIMLSPKYYDPNPNPSITKRIVGGILIALGILSAIGSLGIITSGRAKSSQYNSFSIAIGLAGLGYYLNGLGKGKNYNETALTKES